MNTASDKGAAAAAFLVDVSEADLLVLHTETEGWIVALVLDRHLVDESDARSARSFFGVQLRRALREIRKTTSTTSRPLPIGEPTRRHRETGYAR
jgi:hypothetical protein